VEAYDRATMRRKSRSEAAQWIGRRLQDGTSREEILRELAQDGVPAGEAEQLYALVGDEYRRLLRPRGRALERLLAVGALAGLVGAVFWVASTAVETPVIIIPITPRMAFGGLIGIGIAVAVAWAAGGRRSTAVTLVAAAGDVLAIGFGHAYGRAVDGGGVQAFLALLCAVGASAYVLTRSKPRFDLVVGESEALSWRRARRVSRR
jgi:peptidoglycan/LPS O-acetylase OafA/YrhL